MSAPEAAEQPKPVKKVLETKPLKREERLSLEKAGVAGWLRRQCAEMGVVDATPVQFNCIPPILEGNDVIGCAKTGTGKTLAFALPILQRLAEDPYGIFALVLTPTRELAFQIADQFRVLGHPIGLKDCVVVGGKDTIEQSKELHKRPHILIATPGRLEDHIRSNGGPEKFPLLKKIKFLVLDEADRLLDGQFSPQLKSIFGALPSSRQTLLFSATITDALSRLQEVAVRKPVFYREDELDGALTVEALDQRYVLCPVDVKDAYLVYVVKAFHERRPHSSILIFSQTCRECQALAVMFQDLGFRVGSLHSMISQQRRLAALSRFRSSKMRILLCTDVAARGLDIPKVDLVVNHNVPQLAKQYVHRVGRSARAGRDGCAITFVSQYDVCLVQAIETHVGKNLDLLKVSDKKVSECVTEVLVAKREAELKLDKQNFGERREINRRKQMIREGLDPDEVDLAIEKQKRQRQLNSRQRVDASKHKLATADPRHIAQAQMKRQKREKMRVLAKIADQFRVLGHPIGLKDCVVVGGKDTIEQSKELHRRPHILIATPGRLEDHIRSNGGPEKFPLLKKIKFLVLDEADRLLDGQFSPQLKSIFGALPSSRQTLLFSATITDALSRLQEVAVRKPVFYREDELDGALTVEALDQRYVLCPVDVKDAYLVYVVKAFHERRPHSSILIFSQTCRECQALAVMFQDLGFRVGSLHSMISQQRRLAALSRFRSSKMRILLCTDVAARGLDIPKVDLVVNHNVPQLAKQYVHRVGRSARAGRDGCAITFVSQYDVCLVQAIETHVGKNLDLLKVSDKKVSECVTEVLVAKREAELKLDKQNFGERREVNRRKQMIREGLDPDEVDLAIEKQKRQRQLNSRQRVDASKHKLATADPRHIAQAQMKRQKREKMRVLAKVD